MSKFIIILIAILILFPIKFIGAASDISENISLELNADNSSYQLSQKEIDELYIIENNLGFNPAYSSEIENTDFCKYKKSIICNLTFTQEALKHIQKITTLSADEDAVDNLVEDLARKIDRDPENAKFTMKNGRVSVFSLSKKGIEINKEESKKIIVSYLEKNNFKINNNQTLNLSFKFKDPEISIDSIDNMGIDTLIAEGKSNFRGSTNSRIHNIKVATSRFNGLLLKPGEEFSFVENLGEVDGEHGYLPELVIKKDKTEPEFGGGVCQVSTTTFRAAINAGLEITARRNHAYPVAYYNPQGMDATVYIPRPDLRFINNTPGYILIQTKIEGTELIFQFYGTDDGREVEVIGPKIIERNSDGSMKTTFTQKVYNENGDIMINDVFNSNYDSPEKYPHPGETTNLLNQKPKDWSDNEWKKYKKEHGI